MEYLTKSEEDVSNFTAQNIYVPSFKRMYNLHESIYVYILYTTFIYE